MAPPAPCSSSPAFFACYCNRRQQAPRGRVEGCLTMFSSSFSSHFAASPTPAAASARCPHPIFLSPCAVLCVYIFFLLLSSLSFSAAPSGCTAICQNILLADIIQMRPKPGVVSTGLYTLQQPLCRLSLSKPVASTRQTHTCTPHTPYSTHDPCPFLVAAWLANYPAGLSNIHTHIHPYVLAISMLITSSPLIPSGPLIARILHAARHGCCISVRTCTSACTCACAQLTRCSLPTRLSPDPMSSPFSYIDACIQAVHTTPFCFASAWEAIQSKSNPARARHTCLTLPILFSSRILSFPGPFLSLFLRQFRLHLALFPLSLTHSFPYYTQLGYTHLAF